MIPDEKKERWHYLAVKTLSASLHGISSKHKGNFYCLNFLHSLRTENFMKNYAKTKQNMKTKTKYIILIFKRQ